MRYVYVCVCVCVCVFSLSLSLSLSLSISLSVSLSLQIRTSMESWARLMADLEKKFELSKCMYMYEYMYVCT